MRGGGQTSLRLKRAFTLSEVLITLGIIGIVASMTLPAIIQQNQKKVAATRLKQTYSQLYQAINMAQAQYGDMKNWDVNDNYGTSIDSDNPSKDENMAKVFAEKYLKPYLKYNGTPDTYTLAQKGYNKYITKNGSEHLVLNSQFYIIELVNGVSLFIGYDGSTDTGSYSYPSIYVDINGKTKPNVVGRDLFMFHLDSVKTMRVKPYGYGYNFTRDELIKRCSANSGHNANNLFCTALIFNDGWEIKDDYPW